MDKIPTLDYHFCENHSVDNVIGYYYALAQKEEIPFDAHVDLPKELSVDEMDLCLILSNLLENALEASRKKLPLRSSRYRWKSINILLLFFLIRVEKMILTERSKKRTICSIPPSEKVWESVPSLSAEWQKRTMVLVILLMKMESLPQRLCFALTFKKAMLSFFLLLLPRSCKEELSKPYPEVYFQAAYQYSSEHGIK